MNHTLQKATGSMLPCAHQRSSNHSVTQTTGLGLLPRRVTRNQPRKQVVQAMFGSAFGSPSPAIQVATQIASLIAWGSVAYMGLQLKLQQDAYNDRKDQKECETCGGTGVIDCMCSKWSDGDRGCGTCNYSGKMTCSSCRGGGTAVPIEAKVYIKREKEYY